MKKILLGIILVGIVSCSKDEAPAAAPTSVSIIGKWKYQSSTDGNLTSTTPASGCNLLDYDTYALDQTLKSERGYSDANNGCTVIVSDQKYRLFKSEQMDYIMQSYYNRPTDEKESEYKYKIVDLTANSLTLKIISGSFYRNINGVESYITQQYTGANSSMSTYSRVN